MEGNKTSSVDLKGLRIDPMKSHPFTSPDPSLPTPTVIFSSGPPPPAPSPPPIEQKPIAPPKVIIAAAVATVKAAKEGAEKLHQAAKKGDWQTAKGILENNQSLVRTSLNQDRDTALHVAAVEGHTHFVGELVQFIQDINDVAVKNSEGNTALYYAAISGNVEMARLMVEKHKDLPLIRCQNNVSPLVVAAYLGHRKMAQFLISVTNIVYLTPADRLQLLVNLIDAGFYDIAHEILGKLSPLVGVEEAKGGLQRLVRKRLKFNTKQAVSWSICGMNNLEEGQNKNVMQDQAVKLVQRLWEELLERKKDTLFFGTVKGLIVQGVELGNIEFLEIVIPACSNEIWEKMENDAVINVVLSSRQVRIFNMIYKVQGFHKFLQNYADEKGNTVLHLVAKLPPPSSLNRVPGAALQMQRELLWYKEAEEIVQPQFRELPNSSGKTPRTLFTEEHEKLREEGEKWLKRTASSCSVVAALVATVVFAALFTVPGGNNQNRGIPIFQRDPIFVVFTITDALSLLSSSAALLMFLGIHISKYAEEDFISSLPLKLIAGLTLLFVSIVCMMVAFTSTVFLIFKAGTINASWISIPVVVAALAAIPVILFALQQLPLLLEICPSTYQARRLFRTKKTATTLDV